MQAFANSTGDMGSMATLSEISKVLTMLAAAYPRFTLTDDTSEVYARLLEDIPIDKLKAAALECATKIDFFPSVHELRNAVNNHARIAQGIPSAYEAWQEVSTARPEYGELTEEDGQFIIEHHRHQWSHPLVERVARLLGWPDSFPGDNPSADRAHFFKAYDYTLADACDHNMRLPEVTAYIESARSGPMRLGAGNYGRP